MNIDRELKIASLLDELDDNGYLSLEEKIKMVEEAGFGWDIGRPNHNSPNPWCELRIWTWPDVKVRFTTHKQDMSKGLHEVFDKALSALGLDNDNPVA